ncbi:Sec-independent protein translocase subunit TatA/TatB [Wenyingzhuangia sp. IMCC45574]
MNVLNISLGFVGPGQWVIIAVIVLLLFGGRKIPELMKGLGGGIKEFKKATQDDEEDKKKVEENKE